MATLADVLALMPIFNNALKTAAGEADEARAVIACTMAQHYFETLAATYPKILQSTINVTQTANQETTTWTSTLLRLDGVWLLDANSVPIRKLNRIEEVGGHIPALPWPLQLTVAQGSGTPSGYYANQNNFYWLPKPDSGNTIRLYGFIEQAEFATRASTFTYPVRCKNAIALFATKLLTSSVADDTEALDALAGAIFGPLLKGLKSFDRSQPSGRFYGEVHDT